MPSNVRSNGIRGSGSLMLLSQRTTNHDCMLQVRETHGRARLYTRKSFVYFHLVMYGVLALAGGVLLGQAISRGEKPSGLLGFVVVSAWAC